MMKRLCMALVLLGLAGAASAQLGSSYDRVACCQLTTSLIQDVVNGSEASGDERQLDTEGVPPNVHFLIDTSSTMKDLLQVPNGDHTGFFYGTTNGCSNPQLDAFQASRGWNPAFVYPVPDVGTGWGSDTGFPNLFQDSRYYAYMSWGDSTSPTPQWSTREQACAYQAPVGSAAYTQCLSCLNTKGYFRLPSAAWNSPANNTHFNFVFWGRFLNFNPPKLVAVRAVLKRLVVNLRNVRPGISHFVTTTYGSKLAQRQNPACYKSFPMDPAALDGVRASYLNTLNTLVFNTSTPLARSLLNIGYYFTSADSVYRNTFGFGSGYSYPPEYQPVLSSSSTRSVCFGCQASSVIIIGDGEPTSDNLTSLVINQLRNLNAGPVYCPDSQPCGGSGTPLDWGSSRGSYTDDNPQYYLDDVAKLLATQDLFQDLPGRQSLRVHTIGYGTSSSLLQNAARVSGGQFAMASSPEELQQALFELLQETRQPARPTALANAAVDSPQPGRAGEVLLTRFARPAKSQSPWQGFLYRFRTVSEQLTHCIHGDPWSPGDLNRDGDCQDAHLVDAAGQVVVENELGQFVKRDSPTTPAEPFWEAGQRLKPHPGLTSRWKTRRIFTVIDLNMDNRLDHRDFPIEFSEANASALSEYLGLSDNPQACQALANRLGVPGLTKEDCARLIIRWYRGADALNPDPALREYDRPFLLHDLFHSTPVSVEPPAPRSACGTSAQCLPTLFSGATPMQEGYPRADGMGWVDAYDKYVDEAGGRDKLVLVGSNGGMLHAFHNGRRIGVDPVTQQSEYDAGSGEELWAFVPPDLLPKLHRNLDTHGYFVDGTPMVREVWMDGVGQEAVPDGMKQWSEYRTVAVVGTGRGGVHRFALDLTDLLGEDLMNNPRVPNQEGSFLWMWPQPCDSLSLEVGESSSHFAPQPPPMGAVALSPEADDALRVMFGGGSGAMSPWFIDGQPARERWVVALNGGNDPYQLRGRGLAMVDLATGHTVWSFFHGDGQGRSEHLRYSLSAGPALADVGSSYSAAAEEDGLFDTATVGDTGGQLWAVRFWRPGRWNWATQRVDNWHAARSFQVANLANRTGHPEALRGPFTSMATNVVQPDTGYLRTFVGTGDRHNLGDRGTTCRLGNPRACAEQGCQTEYRLKVHRGFNRVREASTVYGLFAHQYDNTYREPPGPSCMAGSARLEWQVSGSSSCSVSHSGAVDHVCDGSSTSWSCRTTANDWMVVDSQQSTPLYPERFYGVWSYGGAPWRTFNTEAEASAFEANLLTDSNLMNVGQYDASGAVAPGEMEASPLAPGWYVPYAAMHERTSTSAAVVDGCVLWSSFEPDANLQACPSGGTSIARLYQAGFTGGKASCAMSLISTGGTRSRFLRLDTAVSLPEPLPQRMVLGGQVHSSVILSTPGGRAPSGEPAALLSVPVSVSP